jgi:hypothetical protein
MQLIIIYFSFSKIRLSLFIDLKTKNCLVKNELFHFVYQSECPHVCVCVRE